MLKDKRIIVTGATGALGRALVIRLAQEGAQVVALGRSASKLEEVKQAAGGNVRTETVDLSDRGAVRQVADRLLQTLDKVDVLLHNAAVYKNERSVKGGLEEMFA